MDTAVMPSSLWPTLEEIGTNQFIAPVTIMRQQAEAISVMTKNLLEGQVTNEQVYRAVSVPRTAALAAADKYFAKEPDVDEEKIRYAFSLRASALDGAKIRLFTVTHDVALAYPATVFSKFMMDEEVQSVTAEDEEQFRNFLYSFFHSDKIIKILQSLIAQSIGPGGTVSDN